eukprot:TRINITY_DN24421_c4_g1_i1.p2 TRINITY_DN24421_c4_g1~~TRINITY_DN24421_c4_g1_i1.p2  ORF type:complete len:145 (+),score=58.39 TRINITY_DN24421_c4_g1_i1:52-486(+)
MALSVTKAQMMSASKTLLGANPYYMLPRNVTRTVMRENWRFTGTFLMNSQRDQLEYRQRNHSYGNFPNWWQCHFDAFFITFLTIFAVSSYIAGMSWSFMRALGADEGHAQFMQVVMNFGMKGTSPGPVWFEEEARQKKLGLFKE